MMMNSFIKGSDYTGHYIPLLFTFKLSTELSYLAKLNPTYLLITLKYFGIHYLKKQLINFEILEK
jgi:hypothetical protein